jgi:hypothetical protein
MNDDANREVGNIPGARLATGQAGASAEPSRTAFMHSRSRGVWRDTPVFTKRRASRGHPYARATVLVWNELDSVGRVRAEYRCHAKAGLIGSGLSALLVAKKQGGGARFPPRRAAAGRSSISPARCTPSMRVSARGVDMGSPSLLARASSHACSDFCSPAARTTPTRPPRRGRALL